MADAADATIDSAFEAAMAAGKIHGAVICAADISGGFVFNSALGARRTLPAGERTPQRLDDMLYLASATKLITTVAALQCVEDGLLTLDGDLSSLLPELARQPVLPEGATDHLEPRTKPITLASLLSHTSGAAYDFVVPRLAAWCAAHEAPLADGAKRPVEEFFAYPLAFQPGKGWIYGPGLDWAGRAVERVTGSTLGEYVHRRICAPLGIRAEDAQFYPVQGDAVRARLVDLNPDDPEGLGKAVTDKVDMNKRSRGDFGGHGMFMTGLDYLKVLRSLLANDGKLLRPEVVEDMMFRNYVGAEAEAGFQLALDGTLSVLFRAGVPASVKVGYGLSGLLTLEDSEGWYGERTLSWGGGMTFAWFIDRKNGLCGLVAVQAALPIDVPVMTDLKQTFRYDIYRKYVTWKEGQ